MGIFYNVSDILSGLFGLLYFQYIFDDIVNNSIEKACKSFKYEFICELNLNQAFKCLSIIRKLFMQSYFPTFYGLKQQAATQFPKTMECFFKQLKIVLLALFPLQHFPSNHRLVLCTYAFFYSSSKLLKSLHKQQNKNKWKSQSFGKCLRTFFHRKFARKTGAVLHVNHRSFIQQMPETEILSVNKKLNTHIYIHQRYGETVEKIRKLFVPVMQSRYRMNKIKG